MRRRFALLAFAGLFAMPALAEAPVSHADEAVILFTKLCDDTLGDSSRAQDLLGQFAMEGKAEKLGSAKAIAAVGHSSKEVWLLRGPSTLQPLLLDYTAGGCVLSVNDADMAGIRKAFGEAIQPFVEKSGGKLLGKASNSITSDVAEDTAQVALASGQTATLRLTARAVPENDTQHVLRFELKGKDHE